MLYVTNFELTTENKGIDSRNMLEREEEGIKQQEDYGQFGNLIDEIIHEKGSRVIQ